MQDVDYLLYFCFIKFATTWHENHLKPIGQSSYMNINNNKIDKDFCEKKHFSVKMQHFYPKSLFHGLFGNLKHWAHSL